MHFGKEVSNCYRSLQLRKVILSPLSLLFATPELDASLGGRSDSKQQGSFYKIAFLALDILPQCIEEALEHIRILHGPFQALCNGIGFWVLGSGFEF